MEFSGKHKYMKLFRKLFLGMLFVFFLATYSSCGAKDKLNIKNTDIEAGKNIKLLNLVSIKDQYKDKYLLTSKKEKEDFSKLGDKTVTYVIKDKKTGKEEDVDVNFNVVDTTGPKIKQIKKSVKTTKKKFNIMKFISVTDIVDGKISKKNVTCKGKVNLNKPGKYKVTVKAVDKSGNSTLKKIVIKVKSRQGNYSAFIRKITGLWLNGVSSASKAKEITHGKEYGDSGTASYSITEFYNNSEGLNIRINSDAWYIIKLSYVSSDLKIAKGSCYSGYDGSYQGTISFDLGPSGDQVINYTLGSKTTCAYTGFSSFNEYDEYWKYY